MPRVSFAEEVFVLCSVTFIPHCKTFELYNTCYIIYKVPRRHARCLLRFVLICFVSILLVSLSFSIQNHKHTSRNLFFLFAKSVVYTHYIDIPFLSFLRIFISNLFLPCSRTWLYEPASATAQQPHLNTQTVVNHGSNGHSYTTFGFFSNSPSDIIKEDHSVIMASSLIQQTFGLGCESVFRQGLLFGVWFSVYPLDNEEGCFFSSVVTLFYFSFRSSSSSFGYWLTFAHVILMRSRNMCTARTRLDIARNLCSF